MKIKTLVYRIIFNFHINQWLSPIGICATDTIKKINRDTSIIFDDKKYNYIFSVGKGSLFYAHKTIQNLDANKVHTIFVSKSIHLWQPSFDSKSRTRIALNRFKVTLT